MAKSKLTSSDKEAKVETSSEIQLIQYENNDKVAETIKRVGDLQRETNELKAKTDEQITKLQAELSGKLAPIDAEIELTKTSPFKDIATPEKFLDFLNDPTTTFEL